MNAAIEAARALEDLTPARLEELRKKSHTRYRRRKIVRIAAPVIVLLAALPFFSRAPVVPAVPALADGTQITGGDVVLAERTLGLERYTLRSGSARFDVAPNPSRRFVVHAGDATVEVLGTIFTVTLTDAGTAVFVEEGRVRVTDGDGRSVVLVGEAYFVGTRKLVPKISPLSVPALDQGEAALRAGDRQRAARIFRAILASQQPAQTRAFAAFHLGKLAEGEEARRLFTRCIELAEGTPLADDARLRLERLNAP